MAVRALSGTDFLMAVRALLNSFFEGTVRGFSDLTSSHPWQEKRKDSEAAAAEKAEELKDLCSHCFFGCKSLIFFFGGGWL